ncbi:MAG: hypothetical protein ACTSSG_05750 [Candidatus Heimdallarchaeaceae archaeon]
MLQEEKENSENIKEAKVEKEDTINELVEEENGAREWKKILLGVLFIFLAVVGWYVIELFVQ